MKGKIVKIHLYYENESGYEVVEKKDTQWLFIGASDSGWKKISLSGDDRANTFLLKMLDIAITQTIESTNMIESTNKRGEKL